MCPQTINLCSSDYQLGMKAQRGPQCINGPGALRGRWGRVWGSGKVCACLWGDLNPAERTRRRQRWVQGWQDLSLPGQSAGPRSVWCSVVPQFVPSISDLPHALWLRNVLQTGREAAWCHSPLHCPVGHQIRCHIGVSNLQNEQLTSTLAGFRGACGHPSAASTSAGRWGMSE